jgi:endonuclease/exonuclease/phosphatase family metal-dependent hydrolase
MALTLSIGQQPVTFLAVHLKSSCVNPKPETFRGRQQLARPLTSAESACRILRRQVKPLEHWVEQTARRTPRFVILGDFNRKLHLELGLPARGDSSSAVDEIDPPGSPPSKIANLLPELNDGVPVSSRLWLVRTKRPSGCKGFQGLDHILLSESIASLGGNKKRFAEKLPVSKSPSGKEASDHCPLAMSLRL